MDALLNRLRDFSCKTSSFDNCSGPADQSPGSGVARARADPPRAEVLAAGRDHAEGSPYKLDIESALAWLRWELMEMRSQDQALIVQLMELHTGIQELKQELSEEERAASDEDEDEDEGEQSSSWESFSEAGSGSLYSGETEFPVSRLKMTLPLPVELSANRVSDRRRSAP